MDINPVCICLQIHFLNLDWLIFKFFKFSGNVLLISPLYKEMFDLCKSYGFIILKIRVERQFS